MVANLLQLCGLSLGPHERLLGPTASNQKGHFEHTGFHEFNEALLKHLGGSWDNPPDLKPGWERAPTLDTLIREGQSLLETFAECSHWGWKEPRTTILLPFWQRLIPNLRVVICLRSPLEVARSVNKRDGLSIAGAAYLWNLYTRSAIRDTNGYPRTFTFYEDYFRDPLLELNRMTNFCQLKCPDNIAAVQAAISRELRHQTSEAVELLDDEDTPLEYKLLYFGLRALSLDDYLKCHFDDRASEKTLAGASKLLDLMDDFVTDKGVARLQAILAEKEQHWSKLKIDLAQQLEIKDATILKLQQDNDRLQTFSEAVRQTVVYRFYSTFIKPIK